MIFVDVRDVADGIISCVENGRAGECYILSNQFYTIQEVLDDLHEITGKRRLKKCTSVMVCQIDSSSCRSLV